MAEFTCAMCGGTFEAQNDEEWNETKARAEVAALWPENASEEMEVVCDDCHRRFLTWWENRNNG